MRARFAKDLVALELTPSEYSFVFRCLNDRISSLDPDEISPRLGLSSELANQLVDGLLDLELSARRRGDHWLPAKPDQ
jgi:hypothetical protein